MKIVIYLLQFINSCYIQDNLKKLTGDSTYQTKQFSPEYAWSKMKYKCATGCNIIKLRTGGENTKLMYMLKKQC